MASRRQKQAQTHKTKQQMTFNVQQLQELAQSHLTEKEQLRLFGAVAAYRKQPNIAALVEQLAPVCNTPAKRQLLGQIRRLLPEREHPAFDKLLAVHRLVPPPQSSAAAGRPVTTTSGRSSSASGRSAGPRAVDRGSSSLRQSTGVPPSVDRVQPVAESRQQRQQRHAPSAKPTKIVIRPDDEGALGFDIRGGKEHGLGIFISLVEEGSQAQKNGLVAGQLILKTNGISFENITHEKAVEVLTNNAAGTLKKIRLTVLQPNEYASEQYPLIQYFWLDSRRQPTSPPPEYRGGINLIKPVEIVPAKGTRKVSIATEAGKQLGLSVRGGVEHGVGIYVSHVEPNSLAQKYGLQVGNQLLDINGLICNTLMHDEAAEILQANEVLVMTVRNINKVPIRPITPDDQATANWAQSKAATDFLMSKRSPSVTSDPGVRQPAQPVAAARGKRLSTGTVSSQESFGSGRTPSPMDAQMAAAAPNYDPEPTISQASSFGPRTTQAFFGDLQQTQKDDAAVTRNSLRQAERKPSDHRNSYRNSSSFDDVDLPSDHLESREGSQSGMGRQATSPQSAPLSPLAASQRKPQGQASPRTQPSRIGPSKVGPAAARAMIDKNASLVLSGDEMLTMNYYLDQYVERNLSIKQLVMALSTLLDTTEKRHILEKIRAVVGQRDTDRYEELILPYLEEMRQEAAPAKVRPKPPSRQESLVDYTSFNTTSFGHNAYVGSDSDDSGDLMRGNTMDSMMANAGLDTPRSSTMNSEVTFSNPAGSLLPSQGKTMKEELATVQENEDVPSPAAANGTKLRVYEEEFGHESPVPGRKTPSKIVSQKDDEPGTIPLSRSISPALLSSTKLKPTSTNETQVGPESEAVPKENQQAMMLAETLVQRRNKINPGSIRRVVVRHGMPRSQSMDSTSSAQPVEQDETWEEDEDSGAPRRPSAASRGSGRRVSKDEHMPQTIEEESPQPSPRASPASSPVASPRHSKSLETSPLTISVPTGEPKGPERRPPPSPSTAVKAIMNAASRTQMLPSPKMPRRGESNQNQLSPKQPSPSTLSPSPVPVPRSASRQSSLGSPVGDEKPRSPKPRKLSQMDDEQKKSVERPSSEEHEEVVSAPPAIFADPPRGEPMQEEELDDEEPPALPVSSPPQLSPIQTAGSEPLSTERRLPEPEKSPLVQKAPLPERSPQPQRPPVVQPYRASENKPSPPVVKPYKASENPAGSSSAENKTDSKPDVLHQATREGDLYAVPEKPRTDEEKPVESSQPEVHHTEANTGDLYAVPEKPRTDEEKPVESSQPEVHHTEANTGDLYAVPERTSSFRDEVKRDEVPPRRSGLEQEVPLEPRSTRPGKTYAGYTGLFGDIKTILIEKNGMRLGVAVTGGANTKQREVRIKEIVAGGSASTCKALKTGMQILSVDGQSLKGLPHRQAVMLIKSCYETEKLRLELSVHTDQD